MSAPFLAAIMGPTGSGKTDLAEQLANRFEAQLINSDAFQVYRGMDIGTAKPADKASYLLLDLKEPNEAFGLGEFVRLAHEQLDRLFAQGRNAIVVGGTGLYIRALFEEYEDMGAAPDPEVRRNLEARLVDEGIEALVEELTRADPILAAKIDMKNPVRVTRALERALSSRPLARYELPKFKRLKIALLPDKQRLDLSIATRYQNMVQNGWIQEVKNLLLRGFSSVDPGFRAIGYQNWEKHLDGNVGLEETAAAIIAETTRYAKRQRTWIRSEPNVILINPDTLSAFSHVEALVQSLFI